MRMQSHLFWYPSMKMQSHLFWTPVVSPPQYENAVPLILVPQLCLHALFGFCVFACCWFWYVYFFWDIIDVLATPMIFGIAWISRCLICCGLEGYEEGKNETEEMTRDGFGRIRTDLEMLLVLGNGTPRTDDLSRIETDPA